MFTYALKRIVWAIPTLVIISIVVFLIIQLPPGDFLSSYIAGLRAEGSNIDRATIDSLRDRYGLNEPIYVQYAKWAWGILSGDFGYSFNYNQPVERLIWERMALTLVVSASTLLLTWLIALPIGIFSAIRQYSIGDYVATFIGFIGLAIPNFLLALFMLYMVFDKTGRVLTGLFSPEYVDAPWSVDRFADLLAHLWVPVLILGMSGTATLIRIMRANLLDELHKPYVITARAKGLPEWKVILRYPVRIALNPFVSTIGWTLPTLISGTIIVAVVLNLPTTGPLLLEALKAQDMYLAGSFILLLSVLTIIGTFLSDILLGLLDPRIRLK